MDCQLSVLMSVEWEPIINGETGYVVDGGKTNIDDISNKVYDLLII